jgi:radical SAM superfamily enzyme YgiQ (UPF0313 family)
VHAGRRVALLCVDPWKDADAATPFNFGVRRVEASVKAAGIDGADVHLVETRDVQADAIVEELVRIEPDLVAASAYVWSFPTFVDVAERMKRLRPDVTIVFGGPSARPAMFELEPYRERRFVCDALVLGEGEEIFPRIVSLERRDDEALSTLPGLALPAPDGFRSTTPPVPIADLESVPSPYRMGLVPTKVNAHIETYRGCPLSCSFCQWGDAGGNSRVFSREYLANELAAMKALGLREGLLVDAALNLNSRAFRNFAEAEREVGFLKDSSGLSLEVYPSHLTDEHVDFLSQIPLRTIGLGLQSYDKDVLRRMQRPFDEARFERVVRLLSQLDAELVIEVILGLPGDGPDTFMRTVERARMLGSDIRIYHCLVLPDALMTRAPADANMDYDPITLAMRSCSGWTESALRETADRLTSMSDEHVEGMSRWTAGSPRPERSYWWFAGQHSQRSRAGANGAQSTSGGSESSPSHMLAGSLVAKVSAFVGAATGGIWSVVGIGRERGIVVLHVTTPEGSQQIELLAADSGVTAYRVVENVAVRYRRSPVAATPEFLRALDALIPRARTLFGQLVRGVGEG